MLQAVMPRPGCVEIKEIEKPSAGAGQVLLRIQRIGVCGSDIHVFHGQHPLTPWHPVVQGHEFSAVVEAVGEGVVHVQPGDKVTAMPQIVCGSCQACQSGQEHICHNLKVRGFQAPGCAQEYWVTEAEKVVKLPDDMGFDVGALVEPTAVGVHAVRLIPEIASKRVLVLGAGTIGNLLAQVAQASGAERVVLKDINAARLDLATCCGIEHVMGGEQGSFAEAVERCFDGQGYDVVFDCAGVQPALTESLSSLHKGGTFVVVAVYPKPVQVDLTLVQDRELKIHGSLMYQRQDYEEAIEYLSSGQINVAPLISKHFSFKEYAAAYDYVIDHASTVMKVLIDVAE